jgi:hypothetical protein
MAELLMLTGAEVERVREAGGPLAAVDDLSGLKTEKTVVAVEVGGRIVAYWVAFYALHLDPLWIDEAHRLSPAVNRILLDGMGAVVAQTQEPVAFAVLEGDAPHLPQASRLGFEKVPGSLYYVAVPALEPVGG